MALDEGFRGIDTANQRRHYHEAGVGEALASALAAGRLRREDVFQQLFSSATMRWLPRRGLGGTQNRFFRPPSIKSVNSTLV